MLTIGKDLWQGINTLRSLRRLNSSVLLRVALLLSLTKKKEKKGEQVANNDPEFLFQLPLVQLIGKWIVYI